MFYSVSVFVVIIFDEGISAIYDFLISSYICNLYPLKVIFLCCYISIYN
jgi:hypothetical protein